MYWGYLISASLLINLTTIKQISNWNAVLSCFECFPGCLRPSLLIADGAGTKSINARCTCIESACVGSVDAVERSGMHLQSFPILEVRGARIEI